MTKTLEEILTKLEKDFSELKEYAIKLEAENCMLRKELDKKDEDIPDNCAITLAQALNSAYFEGKMQPFNKYIKYLYWIFKDEMIIPDKTYISSFHGEKISKIVPSSYIDIASIIAIPAVILIHYGINIEIDIINFGPYSKKHFNKIYEKYKSIIKFKPNKS